MLHRLIVYNSGYLGSLLISKIDSQRLNPGLNIIQAGGGNIMPRKSRALSSCFSLYQAGLKAITRDL